MFLYVLGKKPPIPFFYGTPGCQKLQAWYQITVFTSQCGREQEVCSVFPDDVVSDGAETGPPAQLPNGLQELGVQRQGEAIVLLSLQGQAVHLPAAELPAM